MFAPYEIVDFGLYLKREGFSTSLHQILAAQEVVHVYAKDAHGLDALVRLTTLLRPIFCSTPEQQDQFDQIYIQWLRQRGVGLAEINFEGGHPLALEPSSVPIVHWRFKLATIGLAIVPLLTVWFLWQDLRTREAVGRVLNESKSVSSATIRLGAQTTVTDQEGKFSVMFRATDMPMDLEVEKQDFQPDLRPVGHSIKSKRNWFYFGTNSLSSVIDVGEIKLIKSEGTLAPSLSSSLSTGLKGQDLDTKLKEGKTATLTHPNSPWWQWVDFGKVFLGLLPLLLALGLLISQSLQRTRLNRQASYVFPEIKVIENHVCTPTFFASLSLRQLTQGFRRRRWVESSELNVERTIHQSIAQAGLFTPCYGSKQETGYLAFINRSTLVDHQANIAAQLVEDLAKGSVLVRQYEFDERPTMLREVDPLRSKVAPKFRVLGVAPELNFTPLKEVQAKFSEKRLLYFADPLTCFHPLTGTLHPWVETLEMWEERFLFTTQEMHQWGQAEQILSRRGFQVIPLSALGLQLFSRLLQQEIFSRNTLQEPIPAQASYYGRMQNRWLEPHSPSKDIITRLLDDLEETFRQAKKEDNFDQGEASQQHHDLGRQGILWLAGCAAYPEIHWGLTLEWGLRLFPKNDVAETLLPQLSQLIWFRRAFMPAWFRQALYVRLTQEEADQISKELRKILAAVDISGAGTLQLSIGARQKYPLVPSKLEGVDRPLRDNVLLQYLSGRQGKTLTPYVPKIMLNFLFPNGQPWVGFRPVSLLVAAFVLSLTLGWWLDPVAKSDTLLRNENIRSVLFLDKPDGRVLDIFQNILDGERSLNWKDENEETIKSLQRLIVFLGYSTSSTGAYVVDGDFNPGLNRGVAQFFVEHNIPTNVTRDDLTYPSTWRTAKQNIVNIPEVQIDQRTMREMLNAALRAISKGEIFSGTFDEALFQLNRIDQKKVLSIQEISERYGDHVNVAVDRVLKEKQVVIHPEWVLAIIKQETGGIAQPRFEQHILTRLNKKQKSTKFVELRYQATSMGFGQILGSNYNLVGAGSAQAMFQSAIADQVLFVTQFLARKSSLVSQLNPTDKAFAQLARFYNGPGYARHQYDQSLARWFWEFRRLRDPENMIPVGDAAKENTVEKKKIGEKNEKALTERTISKNKVRFEQGEAESGSQNILNESIKGNSQSDSVAKEKAENKVSIAEKRKLPKEVIFKKVKLFGGGDADVFTKEARETQIEISTDNLRQKEGLLSIDINYSIMELAPNNTHLKETKTFNVKIPQGVKFVSIGNVKHLKFSGKWNGKNHSWETIFSDKIKNGTVFSSLKIKFDDDGPDDQGNAQLRGKLEIPIRVVKKEELSLEIQSAETSNSSIPLPRSQWTFSAPQGKQRKQQVVQQTVAEKNVSELPQSLANVENPELPEAAVNRKAPQAAQHSNEINAPAQGKVPARSAEAVPENSKAQESQQFAKLSSKITDENQAPMVFVPAGEFTMGSRGEDEYAGPDERPNHQVYLDDFFIDQYEVTTSLYAKFLQETERSPPEYWPKKVLKEHGRKPVIGVTWEDANAYCQWAGKRLPSEAQWEKAARGTDQRLYPWGKVPPSQKLANINKSFGYRDYRVLTDVGSFPEGKSPYGAYDLAGNVWEWVADWYDGKLYQQREDARELVKNPSGPNKGREKVLRGGTWNDFVDHSMRSTYRYRHFPSGRDNYFGFRCAQDASLFSNSQEDRTPPAPISNFSLD